MAYDANPQATHDPTTGVVVPVSWLDILNANFAEIGSAWTSFTPTWTATTTNPVIGNGTLTGAYKQLAKLLFVRYRIVMGSTTTFGTGSWKLRLPNSLSAVAAATQTVSGLLIDEGTAFYRAVAVIGTHPLGIADFDDFVIAGNDTGNLVGPTVPFTWANTDVLVVEGCIEVA